ncbi:hypothetical protein KY284_012942 [Solanum tuberosum]|nr:hypothetical protein KY284_012942 [Solanum tuberosum]
MQKIQVHILKAALTSLEGSAYHYIEPDKSLINSIPSFQQGEGPNYSILSPITSQMAYYPSNMMKDQVILNLTIASQMAYCPSDIVKDQIIKPDKSPFNDNLSLLGRKVKL